MKKTDESTEALMRIPVGLISGLVLGIWKILVIFLVVFNFFVALFSGSRHRGMAEFCEIWNTQTYILLRYVTFVSNKRPFPFREIGKNISKFEK